MNATQKSVLSLEALQAIAADLQDAGFKLVIRSKVSFINHSFLLAWVPAYEIPCENFASDTPLSKHLLLCKRIGARFRRTKHTGLGEARVYLGTVHDAGYGIFSLSEETLRQEIVDQISRNVLILARAALRAGMINNPRPDTIATFL